MGFDEEGDKSENNGIPLGRSLLCCQGISIIKEDREERSRPESIYG